jgi:hypothetical protein
MCVCTYVYSISPEVDEIVATMFLFAMTRWRTKKGLTESLLSLQHNFKNALTNDDHTNLQLKLAEAKYTPDKGLQRFEEFIVFLTTQEIQTAPEPPLSTEMKSMLAQLYDIEPVKYIKLYETRVASVPREHKTFDNEMDKLIYVTGVLNKKPPRADKMSDCLVRFVEHIARSNATFHGNGPAFDAIRAIQRGACNVTIELKPVFPSRVALYQHLHTNRSVFFFLGWHWATLTTLKQIVEYLNPEKQLNLKRLCHQLGIQRKMPHSLVVKEVHRLTGVKTASLTRLLHDNKDTLARLQGYCTILCMSVCVCVFLNRFVCM